MNLISHPLLWCGLSRAGPAWFVPAEAAVGLAEAGACWLVLRRDPSLLFLTSVVANTASVLAGVLVQR